MDPLMTPLDFEADVRRFIVDKLPHAAVDRPTLLAQDTCALIIDYLNWRARLIPPRPRRVHLSKELAVSRTSLPADVGEGLQMTLAAAAAGHDLSARLSHRIIGFDADGRRQAVASSGGTSTSLDKRADLDLLLNDWGLHHLHLSLTPEAPGKAGRSALVLIAAVTATNFYAVDVIAHGSNDPLWVVNEALLPIIVHNWPINDELLLRIKGAIGLSQSFSMKERKQLRQGGVSLFVEIDGAVYTRGGLNVLGASMNCVQQALALVDLLRRHREDMADPQVRAEFFEATRHTLTSAGVKVPALPQWHASLDDDGRLIVTEVTLSGGWPLTIAPDAAQESPRATTGRRRMITNRSTP